MHQRDADVGRAGIATLGVGPRHIGAGEDAQSRLGPEALGCGLAVADVQPQKEPARRCREAEAIAQQALRDGEALAIALAPRRDMALLAPQRGRGGQRREGRRAAAEIHQLGHPLDQPPVAGDEAGAQARCCRTLGEGMQHDQIVEAALGHLQRAGRGLAAVDLGIAFVEGDGEAVLAAQLHPAGEIVARGHGPLRVGGRADIGQSRAGQRRLIHELGLGQEAVGRRRRQEDGLRACHRRGPGIDMIEGARHQHGGPQALALPFRHGGQRQMEQRFPRPGAGHDVLVRVEEALGQMISALQPIAHGAAEIRRAGGLRIARPLGLLALQDLGQEIRRRRLGLAHRKSQHRPAGCHALQQGIQPGEGVELQQRIEPVGHGAHSVVIPTARRHSHRRPIDSAGGATARRRDRT